MPAPRPSCLFLCLFVLACEGPAPAASGDGGAPDAAADTRSRRPDVAADFPDGPVRITVTNVVPSGPADLPWVAFADGDGDVPWQAVAGSNGAYAFEVRRGRFGVAFVCPQGRDVGFAAGQLILATVNELRDLRVACESTAVSEQTHHLTGKITTRSDRPEARYTVFAGGRRLNPQSAQADSHGAYDLELVEGTYDVVVLETVRPDPAMRALIRRGLAVSADTTADFDSADAIDMVGTRLDLGLTNYNGVHLTAALRTAGRGEAGWPIQRPFTEPHTGYLALPEEALAPGDVQRVTVSETSGSFSYSGRAAVRAFRAPVPLSMTLPPPLEIRLATTVGKSLVRPRVTVAPYPDVQYYEVLMSDGALPWSAVWSAGWLGGSSTLELPDFTGAAGWKDVWRPTSQGAANVAVSAVVSNRELGDVLSGNRAAEDGLDLTVASQYVAASLP